MAYVCVFGHFNPRSLTGATQSGYSAAAGISISIHAPLRERPQANIRRSVFDNFNPRSLTGATCLGLYLGSKKNISIHAPLRERPQPSLADQTYAEISIHAPLRERRSRVRKSTTNDRHFNPRSLTGATGILRSIILNFVKFQSTLPYGSDSIKTNYFSINLSQAFFANRLNSNTQEFYFDVRKLLVSHSSPGCEPKLNYMFHITSHRIILHYFSSCQSICK